MLDWPVAINCFIDRLIDCTIKEQENDKTAINWPGAINQFFNQLIAQRKKQKGGKAVIDWQQYPMSRPYCYHILIVYLSTYHM